jgi:hypothetical protein
LIKSAQKPKSESSGAGIFPMRLITSLNNSLMNFAYGKERKGTLSDEHSEEFVPFRSCIYHMQNLLVNSGEEYEA